MTTDARSQRFVRQGFDVAGVLEFLLEGFQNLLVMMIQCFKEKKRRYVKTLDLQMNWTQRLSGSTRPRAWKTASMSEILEGHPATGSEDLALFREYHSMNAIPTLG